MATIYDKFVNRDDIMMKFDDAPFTSGVLNPGWAEPSFDKFFTRVVDSPALLNQSTTLPMTSLQTDLDMLMADVELQSQRNSSGVSTGLTSVETTPNKNRKQLTAQPLQAKAIITDNFIDENIEGEDFLDLYVGMLADEMGPAFEKFGVFADTSVSQQSGEGSAYTLTNGILAQLKAISADSNNPANGLSKIVYSDKIVDGIIDAIMRYIDQDGNIANATCVLPPQIYARFVAAIADRNTDWGDLVFQDGNVTKVLGVEIVQDNVLRETRHGYGSMKFGTSGATKGEYSASGTAVDKMLYGFIGQPNNIVFGMMNGFETKNQWDIDVLGYKVALLVKGDVKVLFDQDTIGIPFTLNTSS